MFNSLQPHGHTSGSPVLHYLPEFAETHFHRVGDPTQLSHPPPPYYPAFNFPSIRVFSNESALYTRWPKYWNFSIRTSSEYSGLNSFRIHCQEPVNSVKAWLVPNHRFNLVFNLCGLLSKEVANCLEKEMANHFSILALRTS